MPRTYKPKAGARAYNSDQPDELHIAYEELQNGQSERAVYAKNGFSRTKYQNFMKVQAGEWDYRQPGCQTVLTKVMEKAIVDHLHCVSEWGFPLT